MIYSNLNEIATVLHTVHNFKQSISHCVQYNDEYKRVYMQLVPHSVTSIQRVIVIHSQ